MLTDKELDIIAALKHLNRAEDLRDVQKLLGICRLMHAGAISSQTLIDRVKAGDMEVARTLAQLDDLASDALTDLIADGDHETARTFIRTLTDGRRALVQAVENDDKDLATVLLALGADGPGALLSLLHTKSREAAGRLIALGVDTHTTLMRAVSEGHDPYETAIHDLFMIGAELSVALLRALALDDTDVAKTISNHGGPSVVQEALLILIKDDILPEDVKAAKLRQLLELGVDTEDVLKKLIDDRKIAELETIIKQA